MAYIGKTPVIGNFQKCDSISVVNGQAAYTLQVGGVNVSPQSENHMLVSLNGILQAPVDSFTVSGSTLTFASNLVTGDVIDFVMILGNVLDLGVPSDNTVSTAKITDDAITPAKLSALANPFASQLLHVQDQKSTNGGASSVGFQTRDLNTILTNEITGASLSSNQITLPAGTYYIDAEVPGYRCTRHNAHLNNDTDSTIEVVGTPQYTLTASDVTNCSFINGRFTISAQKNFSITHYFDLANANGYGVSTGNSEVSIYTNVRIWRTA